MKIWSRQFFSAWILDQKYQAKLRFSFKYHDIPKRAFYQINPYFKSKPVCYATPVYFQLSAPLQSRCWQSYTYIQSTTYTRLMFWHIIALPLDSLLLRGVAARHCFWLRARRSKHARRHAGPCDGLKAGLGLTPRCNRLSNGRAMVSSSLKGP